MTEQKCAQCGRTFRARKQKYCSHECYTIAKFGTDCWQDLTCANCGQAFRTRKRPDRPTPKYCSSACQHATYAGRGNPNWRGSAQPRACQHCGQTFTFMGYPSSISSGYGIFCGKACQTAARVGKVSLSRDVAEGVLELLRTSRQSLATIARERFGIKDETLRRALRSYFDAEYAEVMEARYAVMVSSYHRGRFFEYEVADVLHEAGFVVSLSPKSSTPADLRAVRGEAVVFIQCRLSRNFHDRGEREGFLDYARSHGALPIIAGRNREGAIVFFHPGEGQMRGRKRQRWLPG